MRELADELLIDRRSDGTTVTIRRALEDASTEIEATPGDERGPGHEP